MSEKIIVSGAGTQEANGIYEFYDIYNKAKRYIQTKDSQYQIFMSEFLGSYNWQLKLVEEIGSNETSLYSDETNTYTETEVNSTIDVTLSSNEWDAIGGDAPVPVFNRIYTGGIKTKVTKTNYPNEEGIKHEEKHKGRAINLTAKKSNVLKRNEELIR